MTRFHALLPVRDEADIIAQSVEHMLQWVDRLCVFDTGSVDGTWELLQGIAAREPRIELLGRDDVYFSETRLRSWMFHQARRHMRHGDWFLRVDADEFHHVPPPEFVRTRLRPHETIVYHQYYDFQLTESEVRDWEEGRETVADRARPIADRRRWYIPSVYSEPRLCRYRETMRWPPTVSFPFNAGYVAKARLPIRHYPHRDPLQLDRRCRLRAIMMADSENRSNWTRPERHHWSTGEWRKFVVPDTAPGLGYWAPGTDLVDPGFTSHLRRPHIRAIQRLVHSALLPVLDRVRQSQSDQDYPQPIQPEVVEALRAELGKAARLTNGAQLGNGAGA